MPYLRSFLFDIYFYSMSLLVSVLGIPFLCGPRSWAYLPSRIWGKLCLVGARWILGLSYKVEGIENLPNPPYIIASKHQSAWETVAMCYLFPPSSYVLKKELKYIPLINLHFIRQKVIAIDRKLGKLAIVPMIETAKIHREEKRCIIIYPEGTRSEAGKKGRYRTGVFSLQEGLGMPVVPVALNSGVFWPRRSWLKKKGCITVSILPAIPPGLNKEDFMEALETSIEGRSQQIYKEACDA